MLPRWGDQLCPGRASGSGTHPPSPVVLQPHLYEGVTQGRGGGHFQLAGLQALGAMWKLRTLLSGVGGSEWLVSQS